MNIEQIYKENSDYVHNVIKSYFAGAYDYEIIVPEVESNVWFKVVRKSHQFNYDANIKTWLHKICINESKNELIKKCRRTKGEVKHGVRFIRRTWPRWDWNTPESELVARDTLKETIKKIKRLSKPHRQAFETRYIGEKSYAECAKDLGVSVGTLKSRLFYTHKYLHTEVEAMAMPMDERYTPTVHQVDFSSDYEEG